MFKLGFLANFLSKPILVGFVGGLALDILVSQVAKMLGVKIDSGGEFVDKVVGLVTGLDTIERVVGADRRALASRCCSSAGASPAAVPVGARRARSLATVVVVVADLDDAGVAVLGAVAAGPPTLTWPVIDWTTWLVLVPSAIALTLVTTAEGLLVSRVVRREARLRDATRTATCSPSASATSPRARAASFAVGSSTSRTAAMDQAGSRTQLPSLVIAVGTLLLLVFGTGAARGHPVARDRRDRRRRDPAAARHPGVRRRSGAPTASSSSIGAVCFLVTLFVGSIPGILVAFVLALVNLAKRAANPAIDVLAATGEPTESLLERGARRQRHRAGRDRRPARRAAVLRERRRSSATR